ncbi:peptidase M48, Ste24p [Fibrella aestuarina BUZ 2]|uniref:Peptidase M48, Ste24p n=1 Tax=Fibrella aestuarina BUZ 2 TaxID=1166018 RepID=I0KAK2_9BACT|nr:M48 family metallopeptidase [Fibrella aestuarina]CCH01155.1 peptidase M48, Ste24p [Fibrella aestuarina BUZ 2]
MLRENLLSFPDLAATEFQHPLDRDATGLLKGIDKFRSIIGTLNAYVEHSMHYYNSSSCIQVSETQYPSLFKAYKRTAEALSIAKLPDLYIETIDEINAFASGIDRFTIKINSGLLDILTERETMTIIGHELGHVKCDHMFYNTFTYFIRYFGGSVTGMIPPPFNSALDISVQLALLEWSRRAEFSADRAALLATQDATAVAEALGKIAGYSKTLSDPISVEAIQQQANTFEEYVDDSWMAKFIKVQSMLKQTHPYTVLRVKEILSWADSDHYKKILAGEYQKQVALPTAVTDPAAPTELSAAQKAAATLGNSLSAGLKSFGGFGKKSE